MKKILVVLSIFTFASMLSQETKGIVCVFESLLESKKSTDESNIVDLQEYIENIYINSSKYFNEGAMPAIKKGAFPVMLYTSEKTYPIGKKSSDFKGIDPKEVEEFTYTKVPLNSALYGSRGYLFGMVTIRLKDTKISE